MTLIFSDKVAKKLATKHKCTQREVAECFDNMCGTYLEDLREEHRTDPATLWFIAETNAGRLLKVVFIYKDGNFHIKSAFDANTTEIAIYEKHGK
jgi:uncharacterized DUF497 family protein